MEKEIKSNFYFDNYIIKEINLEFNQKFNSEDPVDLEFDLSERLYYNWSKFINVVN